MPSPQTFTMRPVRQLLVRYIRSGTRVLDPFAGNSLVGTRTNDLNPLTRAQDHMEADDFFDKVRGEGVLYHVILFDPPYSPRQVQECYRGIRPQSHSKRHPTSCSYRGTQQGSRAANTGRGHLIVRVVHRRNGDRSRIQYRGNAVGGPRGSS